jgi:class 3 adenylate cyclase
MDDAVREQGGVVQGFTGDGIMAAFGAPVAFEDGLTAAARSPRAISSVTACSIVPAGARPRAWT